MADNQFSVAVPNILQALMAGEQGYKDVRGTFSRTNRTGHASRRLWLCNLVVTRAGPSLS
jgi:hypothetical protein